MEKSKLIKFVYSEKATKFCEISTVDLTVTTYNKSLVEILQKFVAFSEYTMNFKFTLSITLHFGDRLKDGFSHIFYFGTLGFNNF